MNGEAIQSELAKWLGDEGVVVASSAVDDFGTQIAIAEGDVDGRYDVLRAFALGVNGAGVSVDLQSATAPEVFDYLLRRK